MISEQRGKRKIRILSLAKARKWNFLQRYSGGKLGGGGSPARSNRLSFPFLPWEASLQGSRKGEGQDFPNLITNNLSKASISLLILNFGIVVRNLGKFHTAKKRDKSPRHRPCSSSSSLGHHHSLLPPLMVFSPFQLRSDVFSSLPWHLLVSISLPLF